MTDTTGKEHLAFSDSSLSKLRTDAAGAPIGMPARMDFEARVALGLRLHRFMQVLGDALLQLVHFSLRSGCRRDYGATCPDHWKPLGGGRCEAPFWYFGRCNHVSVFAGYTPADKEDWSSGCEANWPCIGVPAELNASLVDGFNATAAQAAAARLRRHLAAPRHAAGPDAAAARRIALDGAEGEIAEVLAALDTATTPTSAAAAPPVRAAVEASLRSIKLAISGERAAEDADDEDSDLEHAEVAAEAAHHRDALAEAEARRSSSRSRSSTRARRLRRRRRARPPPRVPGIAGQPVGGGGRGAPDLVGPRGARGSRRRRSASCMGSSRRWQTARAGCGGSSSRRSSRRA